MRPNATSYISLEKSQVSKKNLLWLIPVTDKHIEVNEIDLLDNLILKLLVQIEVSCRCSHIGSGPFEIQCSSVKNYEPSTDCRFPPGILGDPSICLRNSFFFLRDPGGRSSQAPQQNVTPIDVLVSM